MIKALQQRLNKVEAEVRLLKQSALRRSNLSIDEKNWQAVKPALKKARAKIFKARYFKSAQQ